ncbi:MAG TPA: DUF3472 domain-containing protein [Mucilaginibacter sp.]|nr:DUF3472 domain-containing protein [Mucilaginibacter sp.]
MKEIRILSCFLILVFFAGRGAAASGSAEKPADSLLTVPVGGNSWRLGKDTLGGKVTDNGITAWTHSEVRFVTWFRIARKGSIKLWLNLKVPDGVSHLTVSMLNSTKRITATGAGWQDQYAGEWQAADTGYVAVYLSGIRKTGKSFADVSNIKLSGSAINNQTAFVKNNEGNYFYWGRRGPSVHLSYEQPANTNIEWFYNEVTVPKGNDVIGSYFMADGFGEGYFGMQVNSPTERHILFSVWSPFSTDDPKKIPEDQKIRLLKKGPDVHAGEFGNEGSGGQSYMLYNWKAGNTYKFLIRARPAANNHTEYTAWFFAPEVNKWQLIASFSRPETATYLRHLHSFLENFEPEAGMKTRRVLFTNQWAADENGKWIEFSKARFTTDNTGNIGYRKDYAGGVEGDAFYLKNCGFFNHFTTPKIWLERSATGKQPDIDLNELK